MVQLIIILEVFCTVASGMERNSVYQLYHVLFYAMPIILGHSDRQSLAILKGVGDESI